MMGGRGTSAYRVIGRLLVPFCLTRQLPIKKAPCHSHGRGNPKGGMGAPSCFWVPAFAGMTASRLSAAPGGPRER